jgi:hypothetical protein
MVCLLLDPTIWRHSVRRDGMVEYTFSFRFCRGDKMPKNEGAFIMDCYHHYNTIPEQLARRECTTVAMDPPLLRWGNKMGIWARVADCVGSKEWGFSLFFCLLVYLALKNEVSWGPSTRLWTLPWRHPGNSVGRYLGGIPGVLHLCFPAWGK